MRNAIQLPISIFDLYRTIETSTTSNTLINTTTSQLPRTITTRPDGSRRRRN